MVPLKILAHNELVGRVIGKQYNIAFSYIAKAFSVFKSLSVLQGMHGVGGGGGLLVYCAVTDYTTLF